MHARTYAASFMRAHARVLGQFIFMMYQASMTQRLAMLVSNQPERRPGRKEKIGAIDTERRTTDKRMGGRETEKKRECICERRERKHPRNVKRFDRLSFCGLLPLPFDLIARE